MPITLPIASSIAISLTSFALSLIFLNSAGMLDFLIASVTSPA
jgi:hypothetical protein